MEAPESVVIVVSFVFGLVAGMPIWLFLTAATHKPETRWKIRVRNSQREVIAYLEVEGVKRARERSEDRDAE